MAYKNKRKAAVSDDDKIKKGDALFEKYCAELSQNIIKALKEAKKDPSAIKHVSNLLLSASEVKNPDTGTVYSVRNAAIFAQYSNNYGMSTDTEVLPRMVTLNAAQKAVANAKKDGIDAKIDFGYSQGLAPVIKSVPIKKESEKGAKPNPDTKDEVVFVKYVAGFKPTPALVNVAQIKPEAAIPAKWLLNKANLTSIHEKEDEIRSLIDFISNDVIKVPVRRVVTNVSYMNKDEICLGAVGSYRNTAAELNTLYHEFAHLTGVRDITTGERLPENKVRESFERYSEDRSWRAQEEMTVQIATNHFLASLYGGVIPEELYSEILGNGEKYIAGWATNTPSEAEFTGILKNCFANAERASSQITRTMVNALEANPTYCEKFLKDFGNENFVAKTLLDNRANNAPKAKQEVKAGVEAPKMK